MIKLRILTKAAPSQSYADEDPTPVATGIIQLKLKYTHFETHLIYIANFAYTHIYDSNHLRRIC